MGKKSAIIFALCLALGMMAGSASANSGGKEASASSGAPTAKLEAFVVNLSTTERYLQLSLALQIANAEVNDKIKMLMPKVRHTLILLLSSKDSEQLQSLEGKHQLMEEIKDGVNKTLDLKEHDGVTDVFFENFVIQ
ncbi:flagellar basal body-associated FliL family protein [Undibacterium sp. CY18W]|uniref:Flagellar protein FliL n=1 Tax=Undibacterium hunanense TaxID=2762292 RepID=A0ABR6ZLV3_9BURK|nr:flagellar basal body-associated FliL family protein [Undibacterium hunanense]MBC3916867.1 flagellar basal body-associated FliL family protein [Undibacterium hunanense]